MSLPITILWGIKITMRKKILLSAMFGLTLFTVSVTLIRGAVHNEQVAVDFADWTWFWLSIEFTSGWWPLLCCPDLKTVVDAAWIM